MARTFRAVKGFEQDDRIGLMGMMSHAGRTDRTGGKVHLTHFTYWKSTGKIDQLYCTAGCSWDGRLKGSLITEPNYGFEHVTCKNCNGGDPEVAAHRNAQMNCTITVEYNGKATIVDDEPTPDPEPTVEPDALTDDEQDVAGFVAVGSGDPVAVAEQRVREHRTLTPNGDAVTVSPTVTSPQPNDNTHPLYVAMCALASVCDGARAEDAAGFNAVDTAFGHALAARPYHRWTTKQRAAGFRMIGKYRGQLAHAFGIDYGAMLFPDAQPEPPVQVGPPAKRRIARVDGQAVIFDFDFDWDLVAAVKSIPGRRFEPKSKLWSAPLRVDAAVALADVLISHDFEYEPELIEQLAALADDYVKSVDASKAADADYDVPGLGGTLRPFQRAGVAYIAAKRKVLLGDEMGLGKTVQALASIQATGTFPALIVCPASLKLNWQREARTWLPGRTVVVADGRTIPAHELPHIDVLVINYDLLVGEKEVGKGRGGKTLVHPRADLVTFNPKAVIFDESHYLKNGKAQRSQIAQQLAPNAELRLCLSGTPVVNRPMDLVNQLAVIGRLNDFGGFWSFAKRYCGAEQNGFGWSFDNAQNLDELNERLRGICYVRRDKLEVLKELPPKTRTVVPVELTNRDEYAAAESNVCGFLADRAIWEEEFLATLEGLDAAERMAKISEHHRSAQFKAQSAEQLVRFGALKQVAAKGKLAAVKAWVTDFLESGQKLVLFAYHTDTVRQLAATFACDMIYGDTPVAARQAAVDRFQNDPNTRVIVLNIRSGGVGLTLTAASNVAFVELDWNPAAHDQAEDRCHRIGQHDNVTAWYLLAEDTIDGELWELIESKRSVVTTSTVGGDEADISIMAELGKRLLRAR